MLTAKDFYLNCVDFCLSQFGINLEKSSNKYHFWIAYSGGVDSRVLLELAHLAFKNKLNFTLTAVHINHGVNSKSDYWENHCSTICKNLNIQLRIEKLIVDRPKVKKLGLEAALRESRIAIWHKLLLLPEDILFLAHHLNDQVETIFFRLLRGTGVHGLSGIKRGCILNNVKYLRPLLNNTKEEILDYAKQHKLNYIEDDSNLDLKFARNFLRHVILPKFYSYWPKFLYNINRAAYHLQETDIYINNQVQQALLDCYIYDIFYCRNNFNNFTNIKKNNILSISKLLSKDPFLHYQILRKFIIHQTANTPSKSQIDIIYKEIINAKIDAQPKLKIDKYLILKYRNNLYIYLEQDFIKQQNNINNINNKLGNLHIISGNNYKNYHTINNMNKAKKIFQKYSIPPWCRPFYSLIFINNKLITIVGLWNKFL